MKNMQAMKKLSLNYTTMTEYDKTFKNVHVVFENDNLNNTLGEILANNGKKQIRIAETEKYPHVSFFFSGGRETPFEGERRIMIPSPKVATYDLKPEMSANEVTDAIVPEIEKESAEITLAMVTLSIVAPGFKFLEERPVAGLDVGALALAKIPLPNALAVCSAFLKTTIVEDPIKVDCQSTTSPNPASNNFS